jgi:hypothetical protein
VALPESPRRQRLAALGFARHRDHGAEQRHDGERDEERADQRERDRERQTRVKDLHLLVDEKDRQEHDHRAGRGGQDRQHHLARGADHDRVGLLLGHPDGLRVLPEVSVLLLDDVLQHHDGVVHQHADAERYARERHHVDADVAQVHEAEGQQNRQRDRHQDHARVLHVADEHPQDHRHQQGALPERADDVADGLADEDRLVGDDLHRHSFRQDLPLEARYLVLDLLGGADRVRLRLLLDVDGHRGLLVQPSVAVGLQVEVAHLGDVAQADARALLGHGDRHLLDVFHGLELAHGAHVVGGAVVLGLAGEQVEVVLAQLADDLSDGELVGLEPLLVELDQDLALAPAAHLDVPHAVDARQAGLEAVVHDVAELLGRVFVAGERDDHDGVVVLVVVGDDGLLDVLGQLAAHLGQALLYLQRREGHVRARLEDQGGDRAVLARHGHEAAQLAGGGDGLLHDLGDERLDVFRG